jgi:alpha-tubulin suppressor-like RCC1 family protein
MSKFFRIDNGLHLKPSGAPSSPVNGDIYYDTALDQLMAYVGGSWVDLAAAGSGAVTSLFGRTGAVTAQSGDYNTSQVTESGSLYFTDARAIAAVLNGYISGAGTVSATDSILQAIQKLNGNIAARQEPIQFEDEGSNLGTSGTVNAIDFTGTGVTATRIGDTLTVTASSAGGLDIYYDNGTSAAIDFNNGYTQKFTLDGNKTLSFANPSKAGDYYILVTATGSFSLSVDTDIVVDGGSIPSMTNGQTILLRAVYADSFYTVSYSAAYTAPSGTFAGSLGAGVYSKEGSNVVYTWGTNNVGQLGNNTISNIGVPTINNVRLLTKMTANGATKFGIDPKTGMIWGWGSAGSGTLGNNTTTNVSSPVTIARTGSYSQVASCGAMTYAIDAGTGMVWIWGFNSNGSLGTNNASNASSPVTISRTGSYSYVGIDAGTNNGYAIDAATGMVWAWGLGSSNFKLGNNTGTSVSSPVTIARTGSYSMVAGAGATTHVIDAATGMIWGWGSNSGGWIGNNSTNPQSSPVTIARTGSYSYIAGGGFNNTYAIDAATGMIWSWGTGSAGTLGNNTLTAFASSPVTIARTGSYSMVAAYGSTAWAVEAVTGTVFGWGLNDFSAGSVTGGFGLYSAISSPNTIPKTASYTRVYASASAAGVIDPTTKMITYWGQGGLFVTANGASADFYNEIPRTTSYSQVAFGVGTAYAIDSATGMIWSWGTGGSGQLGNNTITTNASSPVTIARTGSYSAVASVSNAAYAIDAATGMVYAWGIATNGTLGNNTATNTSSPVTIARTGSYSAITAGVNNGFAIDAATGMVWGWGLGTSGQLGNSTLTTFSSPVTIARTGSYRQVSSGNNTTHAIDAATGMIWGWGIGTGGQIGNNNIVSTSSPVTISRTGSYSAIATGASTSFAIDAATGMVWGWGLSTNGALGNNTLTTSSSPVTIARTGSYSAIATAGLTGYAVEATTGRIYAWGDVYRGTNIGSIASSPISIGRIY